MADNTADLLGMSGSDLAQIDRDSAAVREGRPLDEPPPAPTPQRSGMGLSDLVFEAPEREAEREPEPRQEERTPEPQRDEQPRMVPSQALGEERERRRQAEQAAADAREAARRTEERFQAMQELISSQQQAQLRPQEDAIPDPNEDLVGYVRAIEKRHQQQIQEITQRYTADQTQTREQQELSRQVQTVKDIVSNEGAAYAQQTPDLVDAYNWHRQRKIDVLTAQGIDAPTARSYVDNEEVQIAARNIRSGRNTAEAFYAAAKAMGWSGQQQSRRDPAPTPAPRQHGQSLTNIRSGMMEGSSLGQAAQGGTSVPRSLEAYANMSDAEFSAHLPAVNDMIRRGSAGRR